VSSSQTYVRFRTALAGRDLSGAIDAAKALPGYLSLLDALELTLLAAETEAGGNIFEDCAARWLARVAVERGLTLTQVMEAGSTLQAAARGEADNAHQVLASLL
jgi:hypothetical protein